MYNRHNINESVNVFDLYAIKFIRMLAVQRQVAGRDCKDINRSKCIIIYGKNGKAQGCALIIIT